MRESISISAKRLGKAYARDHPGHFSTVTHDHRFPATNVPFASKCAFSAMPTIYLYAEVLANIRQANLYASLETHKNEHTKIDIASDKKTVTVSHDGETASIYLPTEIGGTAEVNIPVNRGKEMSVRLELADIMNMPSMENALENERPWSANDLTPNTHIRCRSCKVELLDDETPTVFKDLPSEHWAEMMDFWHCHRPHDHQPAPAKNTEEAAADIKGYGSSNKLKAMAGVACVDNGSVLLAEQSCRNIQVRRIDPDQPVFSFYLTFFMCSFVAAPISLLSTCPFGQKEGDLFQNRKRYHVQAADTIAPNQSHCCRILCSADGSSGVFISNWPQSFSASSP
jgi:HECT-like Ubiquitin-conjugating enzyme (E2)-binding